MISHPIFLENLAVAVVLGGVIGIERQWRQRLAGLRTNSLVAAGSALFVLLSQMIPNGGDLSRIASYVVSGVGFLGAGVIMKEGSSIRGLNTAATLWCSAAVGALAGFGMHFEAVFGALAVLGVHVLLRPFARLINRHSVTAVDEEKHYRVRIVCREDHEVHIRFLILQAVGSVPLVLQSLQSIDLNDGTQKVAVTADLDSSRKQDQLLEQIVSRLSLEMGVSAAAWASRTTGEALA